MKQFVRQIKCKFISSYFEQCHPKHRPFFTTQCFVSSLLPHPLTIIRDSPTAPPTLPIHYPYPPHPPILMYNHIHYVFCHLYKFYKFGWPTYQRSIQFVLNVGLPKTSTQFTQFNFKHCFPLLHTISQKNYRTTVHCLFWLFAPCILNLLSVYVFF